MKQWIYSAIYISKTHYTIEPDLFGAPKGVRTPVGGLKGRSPRPLDDGGKLNSRSNYTQQTSRCKRVNDKNIRCLGENYAKIDQFDLKRVLL